MSKINRAPQYRLTTGMARTTAPSSSSDGCDITSWHNILDGVYEPDKYYIFLGGSAAATVTGAALWLYFADLGLWENVGLLNGGSTITITSDTQEYLEEVQDIGTADRMAIVGTWSTGTPFAAAEPIIEAA